MRNIEIMYKKITKNTEKAPFGTVRRAGRGDRRFGASCQTKSRQRNGHH